MPTVKAKGGEIEISAARVARMADRMFRLGGDGRRRNYAEKAKQRLESGPARKDDAAIVTAAGG